MRPATLPRPAGLATRAVGPTHRPTHPPSPHHTHTQRHTPPTTTQVADESPVVLNGFGTVVNALGQRAKPYLPQICGTIKWRLNNKSAKIRQQAAELISRIAPVMVKCEEEKCLVVCVALVDFELLARLFGRVK